MVFVLVTLLDLLQAFREPCVRGMAVTWWENPAVFYGIHDSQQGRGLLPLGLTSFSPTITVTP